MKNLVMSLIGMFAVAAAMLGFASTANAENQHNVVRDSSTQGTVKEVEVRTFQGTVKETEFRGSQGEVRSAEIGAPLGGTVFEADVREGYAAEKKNGIIVPNQCRWDNRSHKGTNDQARLNLDPEYAEYVDGC